MLAALTASVPAPDPEDRRTDSFQKMLALEHPGKFDFVMDRYALEYISHSDPVRFALPGIRLSLLAVFFALPFSRILSEEVNVAVAANFAAPAKEISAAFEKETGHRILLSSGSTGKFFAQIKNGAPYDILLSADQSTPERLAREGLALADTRFTYAVGRLVLWSATPGLVDEGANVLKSDRFRHLAIANAKLAPYGAAAEEVLEKLGLLERLRPRLVIAENISQAHQFVAGGSAELGFVSLSQVIGANGKINAGSAWLIPPNLYTSIKQDAVLIKHANKKNAARSFLIFLRSEKARVIIRAFGYAL